MALQRLSAVGRRVLASTHEFDKVMDDDEIDAYLDCRASDVSAHPMRFVHYYDEKKQFFVQSCVTFARDRSGAVFPIAHDLLLSETETRYVLNEHISPFSPAMFANARPEGLTLPKSTDIPSVEYRFLKCGDREHNSALISKFFRSDIFARFILAVLLSAGDGKPVYIALPDGGKDASLNAVRIMNAVIPAFPAEHRKKLGFMTYVTEARPYAGVSVYFTEGIDLKGLSDAYCFDLSGNEPFVSGADAGEVKKYHGLIRAVMGNVLSYDAAEFNDCLNDVLKKDNIGIERVNDIFRVWSFVSSPDSPDADGETACRLISEFYDISTDALNTAAFRARINVYWERLTEKCKAGGKAPAIGIFDVVNSRYPKFSDEEKRLIRRIWTFIIIYTMQENDTSIYDSVFSPEYDSSDLVADMFSYVLFLYVGVISRGDKTSPTSVICGKMTESYVKEKSSDREKLYAVLAKSIRSVSKYCEEMGIRSKEYDLFSASVLGAFEEPIAETINVRDIIVRFDALRLLKESISDAGSLGKSVYEHFCGSCFVPGFINGFKSDYVEELVLDRKKMFDLSKLISGFPELYNIENVSLYQKLCDIVIGKRDLTILFSFNDLVNKPEQQKTLVKWLTVYNGKYPEFMLSLLANLTCTFGDGGNMVYTIDYTNAYRTFFEASDHDREQMLREFNRFIPEVEAAVTTPAYKPFGLAAYRDPTAAFINKNFFDKSIDRKILKENEFMLKRFENIRNLRAYADGKKHTLFKKL